MKTHLLISALTLWSFLGSTQTWQWSKSEGNTGSDQAMSVVTDLNGNILMTGQYGSPTLTFGNNTLTNAMTNGAADAFVVKYNSLGNVLWTQNISGKLQDIGHCIITDALGNVYVSGKFESDTLTIGSTLLFNSQGTDIFLLKFDSNGNLLWAKNAGGAYHVTGGSLAVDPLGNVVMTGSFNSPDITFGSTILFNSNPSSHDVFMVKYDPNGNVTWAKSFGGKFDDFVSGNEMDTNGNPVICGHFKYINLPIDGVSVTNSGMGTNDIFVAKFDPNGDVIWLRQVGGNQEEYSSNLTLDKNDNVIISGSFQSASITINGSTLTNIGGVGMDAIIVKYDANGGFQWARNGGGTFNDNVKDLVEDVDGNVYVLGDFTSEFISFDTTSLSNAGGNTHSHDLFLTKYDMHGNLLWTESYGGTGTEWAQSICSNLNGEIFISGFYTSPTLQFGPNIPTISNLGSRDIFLSKLGDEIIGGIEIRKKNNSVIYPNPFTDQATIKFNERLNNATFYLYNTMGQKVLVIKNFVGDQYLLTKKDLLPGTYLLMVIQENELIAKQKLSIL